MKKENLFIERFASLQAFIEQAQKPTANPKMVCSKSEKEEEFKFTGTHNFAEAISLAKSGWPEGLKMLTESKAKLKGFGTKEAKKIYNDFVGFAPNVPLYLQGSPVNMFAQKKIQKPAKVVKILYNISRSCLVTTEQISEQGAKVLSIIEALEKSGVRVRLDLVDGIFNNRDSKGLPEDFQACIITAKRPDQKLNLNTLAYTMLHASFLRRLVFSWYESRADKFEADEIGYGRPAKLPEYEFLIRQGWLEKDYKIFSYETDLDKEFDKVKKEYSI